MSGSGVSEERALARDVTAAARRERLEELKLLRRLMRESGGGGGGANGELDSQQHLPLLQVASTVTSLLVSHLPSGVAVVVCARIE